MKRSRCFLLFMVLVCLALLFAGCGQKEKQVDAVWDGVLITGDGARTCQVKVKGTAVSDRPDGETPFFTTREDGGIWVDGTEIEVPDIGFFSEEHDYSLLESGGDGIICAMGHAVDLFVYCGTGETGPFVVLASDGDDPRIPEILERLTERDEYAHLVGMLKEYLEE